MSEYIKPSMLNRICAHAEIVTCVIFGCVFDVILFWGVSLRAIAPNLQWTLYLIFLALPAATLLGALLGTMFMGQLIRFICSRINGAPLKPGDQVLVLSGPDKGVIAEVYGITKSQGGWDLAAINLGLARNCYHQNVFEQYTLLNLKIKKQTQELKENP